MGASGRLLSNVSRIYLICITQAFAIVGFEVMRASFFILFFACFRFYLKREYTLRKLRVERNVKKREIKKNYY